MRIALLAAVLGALLVAPATWAAQTLGHATDGTFPAGGPVTAGQDRAGGPGQGGRMRFGGGPPPAGMPGFGGGGPPSGGGGFGGGGRFGDSSASLAQVSSYVAAHGGGTIAVSSQTGASSSIIASGADVAGIGGFSGRESSVSTSWLADAVRSGRIRWVIADSAGGGMRFDTRTGSSGVMAAVASTCKPVTVGGTTLYDCAGSAAALAAAR